MNNCVYKGMKNIEMRGNTIIQKIDKNGHEKYKEKKIKTKNQKVIVKKKERE